MTSKENYLEASESILIVNIALKNRKKTFSSCLKFSDNSRRAKIKTCLKVVARVNIDSGDKTENRLLGK